MASDIFDYLYWRGDLSFEAGGFNELDAAVLARFSYIPFEKSSLFERKSSSVTVGTAARAMLAMPDIGELVMQKEDVRLLASLAVSPRFENAELSDFVNTVDTETETQFSAMTVRFSRDGVYIAYRGTDNTLVGWKEDLNMAFGRVPSQRLAAEYLNDVAEKKDGEIILGGHSKGGNLAVYGAAFCDDGIKGRIKTVYNFDGPGFDNEVLSSDEYKSVCARVRTLAPQTSIVGMLLGHGEKYTVVYSSYVGILQHDIYSWSVRRTEFSYVEEVDDGSRFVDYTIKAWLESMTPKQREELVDAVYDIILKTNATTVREISENPVESALSVLRSIKNLDGATKDAVGKALLQLLKSTRTGFQRIEKE